MKRQLRCTPSKSPFCRLTALLLILHTFILPAQDLHVHYDLFTDSVSYQKEGLPVKNPKIRKGDRVVVHFTEFNPYLYKASAEVSQRHADDWAGSSGLSAFAGLVPGMGSLLPGMAAAAPADPNAPPPVSFLDVPLLRLGQSSFKLRDLFGNSRGPDQLLDQAKIQLQELTQLQSEMAEIYQEIQVLEKSEQAGRMALKHIDFLLHNPQLKPSLIKRVAMEYEALSFPDKSADALRIDDAFRWQERPAAKRRLVQNLEAKQREFDVQMLQLSPITQQLSDLDLGSPALEEFARDLRGLSDQSGNFRQQLSAFISSQTKKQTQDLSLEELMSLQLRFRELAEQPFTFDCPVQIENDVAIVTATFSPRDTLGSNWRQNNRTPQEKTVKLETRGGLRINTGFGVGFSQFFTPEQKFSVRDNVIVADNGGSIQPSLTTFLHFYAAGRSGMALAGTFGLGIPLGGGSISSLNFFLGPSLLFGRGQRIVLSGGLVAGPVSRLAKGFKAGDAFDPDNGDIPLQTRYELGYFVGISFNMGK